ncbi:hypothetical protein [Sporosarcina sp. UB5]|uniref:hypothetical protein n=1 Tax=Sporosarcina sp. UB5 TaxID=3047463 RepID=UPI003D791C8C
MKNIVNVPEELLAGRILLSEIINRDYDKIALILLGENMDPRNYREELSIIRLYLFMKEGGDYLYEKELDAFSFKGMAPALDFLEAFPKMSALDYLSRANAPSRILDGYRVD